MKNSIAPKIRLLALTLLLFAPSVFAAGGCSKTKVEQKQVFWGDLHVHSGYSLDAWGYGTASSPAQAYAFAKGAPISLADGTMVTMERPLDFMSVTDHAEWFNLMYVCTDPLASDHEYCRILTEKNAPQSGSAVFGEYVLPTITKAIPQPTPLCNEQPELCRSAHLSQWQRIQAQANAANEPCEFTSFVGFEWSATPNFSHNHRNLIFADANVTADAIDYMRYPTPEALWRELEHQCRPEDGCSVIAIPHNSNMGDGKSFDIETESPQQLALRAKYEKLIEIHQQKGNSECLPSFGRTDEDCSFEPYITKNSRPAVPNDFSKAEWEQMRGGYVRRLLLRGLYGYEQSGARQLNPLQLGIIGSTDNHSATGGFADDQTWPGSVFGLGDFDRAMARIDFNPGGLVGVWAQENTRASIFAALQRREVYATSGPRIPVRLTAATESLQCTESTPTTAVSMGGLLASGTKLYLRVQAQADRTPLQSIEIVKGELKQGELIERVLPIWQSKKGGVDACALWHDADFDPQLPAFWYARVKQLATPRWSPYACHREGRCVDYPDANQWIQERAWTSPIWHLPSQNP